MERELKAAQAAKKERIREHELHLAIEETEVSTESYNSVTG